MLVVGLTGGIGSGKSSFCNAFSRLGVPIIDADIIAHDLSRPYSSANFSVAQALGEQALLEDGTLNRAWIRSIIFHDRDKKKLVEGIFHPLILQAVIQKIRMLQQKYPYCILSVPLLFEQKDFLALSQYNIVIDCNENEQITRVMKRSGLNREQVLQIIATQMQRSERVKLADYTISNEDQIDSIDNKVSQLHKFLLEKT